MEEIATGGPNLQSLTGGKVRMSKSMTSQKSLQFLCIFFLSVLTSDCAQKENPVPISISPKSSVVLSARATQFTATVAGKLAGELKWYVNGIAWGSPAVGTISSTGFYMAPQVTVPDMFQVCAAAGPGERLVSECSIVRVLTNGTITPTPHPLVAKYTFLAPPRASVKIEFGPDTNYGRETWAQRAPRHGGEVEILVAGMRSNTLYHMRAQVTLGDGLHFVDDDHTFITGDLPVSRLPNLVAQTTPGQNAQRG